MGRRVLRKLSVVVLAASWLAVLPMSARASDWSTVASPDATSTYGYLSDVSCWSSSGCISVGTSTRRLSGGSGVPTLEEWDGTSWSVQAVLSFPSGVTAGSLGAISCTSQSFCIAVGSYTSTGTPTGMMYAKWDGSHWSAATIPDSSGYSYTYLTSVSCVSSTDCTAVGAEDTYAPLIVVEHWDGTSWTNQTAPSLPTGSTSLAVTGVACVPGNTSDVCTLVGSYRDSDFADQPLAIGENWPGQSSGWQSQTMDSPSNAANLEPTGVACPSATACFAVGSYTDTSAGSQLALAEKWDGSAWSVQNAPSAPNAFGDDYSVGKVSCNSDRSCSAVGNYFGGGFAAIHWDGSSWSMQSATSPPPPYSTYPSGVSCPAGASDGACMLVGDTYDSGQYGGALINQALAMQWTGSAWTLTGPVTLPGALGTNNLTSASCTSATACVAVGWESGASSWALPVAEIWDGTSWTLRHVPSPNTDGYWDGSRLSGISCTSASFCIAVGASNYGSGGDQPLAEHWNGSTWSKDAVSAFPVPSSGTATAVAEGLTSISCWASNHCMAITAWNQGSGFMSEKWDGSTSTWTAYAIPDPSGGRLSNISAPSISCASASDCMAVGTYSYAPDPVNNPNYYAYAPVAEHWDGTSWTASTPWGGSLPTGVTGGYLYGVSCSSSSMCMAVGVSNGTSSRTPLALVWSGSGWSDTSAVMPSTATNGAQFEGVSCTSSTTCTAVGSADYSANAVTENWTQAGGWTVQTPDPGVGGALHGVSCVRDQQCFAAGSSSPDGGALIEDDGITSPTTFALSISHAGAGTGAVTGALQGSPTGNSIDCWDHDMCEALYGSGAMVTLNATPASGSTFTGWAGACSGTATTCTVTMSSAQDVTAQFALVPPATRSTSTSVSCTPAPIALSQPTTCTATVSDTSGAGATTPRGTVAFTSQAPPNAGSFSNSATCTLSSAGSCSVTFTPSVIGTPTIVGTYTAANGDTSHVSGSQGSTEVSVHARATSTAVTCGATPVTQATSCHVTVTDTDQGAQSAPTGGVVFSTDSPGTFGSGGVCTLQSASSNSSQCQIAYTPTQLGTHTIIAGFNGDSTHTYSTGYTFLSVSGTGSTGGTGGTGTTTPTTTTTTSTGTPPPHGTPHPPSGTTSPPSGTTSPPSGTTPSPSGTTPPPSGSPPQIHPLAVHVSPIGGGIIAVSASVPAAGVGGSATGSTQILSTCMTNVSACATGIRLVNVGQLLRKHLKAGKLTLQIKPSNKALLRAIRAHHIHRLRALLTLTIRSRSGQIISRTVEALVLRF